jgi:peroxiredoxin
MAPRTRLVVATVAAGLVVGVGSVAGGVWLADAWTDEPEYDGSFVLDTPGVFQEPIGDVNDDATGATLPDTGLTDAEGRAVSLAEYRGAPLVVNFWFSRCAPCRRELRDFAEVHAELGDRVQFVGVNPFDTPSAMARFAAERGVEYELLRDDGALSDAIGIVAYPVTLFVDADGDVVRQTGEIDADGLRSAIGELFG